MVSKPLRHRRFNREPQFPVLPYVSSHPPEAKIQSSQWFLYTLADRKAYVRGGGRDSLSGKSLRLRGVADYLQRVCDPFSIILSGTHVQAL